MPENPHAPVEVGLTIKIPESVKWAGDNPWFTFKGSDANGVKAQVLLAFGMDPEENADLSLFDVGVNAQKIASAVGLVSSGLGGQVIQSGPKGGPPAWAGAKPKAEPSPEEQEEAEVKAAFAKIEASKSVDEVKQVWAKRQELFAKHTELMDAYKAKGKALLEEAA